MTLEPVTLTLVQLVPSLRQLQADRIGTSAYVHVNTPHTNAHMHYLL